MIESTQRATPVLVYADIPAAHDFLVGVFHFQSGGVQTDRDGNAIHGEVVAGVPDAVDWITRALAEDRKT